MLFLSGLLLWMLALLLTTAVLFPVFRAAPARVWGAGLIFLLVVWRFFYFPPQEEVLGGDDPAAYLSTAFWFLQTDRFAYEHPLWTQLHLEQRDLFYYRGQGTEVKTLHHIMRVRDEEQGVIAPWFQVAFPLMISVPARWGGPECALWTAPLLALLGALVFGGFCWTLWDRFSGFFMGALLMLGNPLWLFHGRILRSELPALLFLWGGLTLFLRAVASDSKRMSSLQTFFAAFALCLSGFFHATGWLLPFTMGLGMIPKLLRGKRQEWIFAGTCWAMGWLFLLQMAKVSDIYNIRAISEFLLSHLLLIHAGLLVGLFLWFRGLFPRIRSFFGKREGGRGVWFRLQYAVPLLLGVLAWTGWQSAGLPFPLRLLSFSDLRGFVHLQGLLPSVLGGVGLWFLLWGKEAPLRNRKAPVLLWLLPGLLLSHVVKDYMYGSRYFLMVLMPTLSLGGLALLLRIPTFSLPRLPAQGLLLTGFLLLGLQDKHPLLRHPADQGLISFLRQPAEILQAEEGMLLVEYSRLSTPFVSLFGIPTLGMDNAHQTDATPALQAWGELMALHPDRPAFLMTPFAGEPRSPQFRFEKIWEGLYQTEHLLSTYPQAPSVRRDWRLRPRLYRIHKATPADLPRPPGEFVFSESNLGRSGFARVAEKSGQVWNGVSADDSRTFAFEIPPGAELFLFGFVGEDSQIPNLEVERIQGGLEEIPVRDLPGAWICYRIPAGETQAKVSLRTLGPVFLTQATLLKPTGESEKIALPGDQTQATLPGTFVVRWAGASPRLELPGTGGDPGYLLIYGTAPGEFSRASQLTVQLAGREFLRTLNPGEWEWMVFPYHPAPGGEWMRWTSDQQLQLPGSDPVGGLTFLTGYGTAFSAASADK
ncbi:MAG: hypothetical protein ACO3N7_09610 [Kiritimatiellia bacterium]